MKEMEEEIIRLKKEDYLNLSLFSILKNFEKIPEKISYLGKVENFNRKTKYLLVVGSRKHSKEAELVLNKIFSDLKGKDIVIISGLARGVDSLAHRLALKYGLKTIAIPGSGLNPEVLYPKINYSLAKEILKNEGLLVSEFENDFQATPWSFPKRNELMVQLADGVLVVEAGEKSGTMITARLALDYDKDLFVIPNSILSEYFKGSNRLIQEGAYPVLEGKDILKYWDLEGEVLEIKLDFGSLNEKESLVMKKIKEPKSLNEIYQETGIDLAELNQIITLLEIKGFLVQKNGKVYRK